MSPNEKLSFAAVKGTQKEADEGADKDAGKKETVKFDPDKGKNAYRTIGEVADYLGVEPHVLRFWETKFTQIRPMKRAGGRRYFRPEDVELLVQIRDLLKLEGYTIKGVQKLLKEKGRDKLETSFDISLSQGAQREISSALEDLAAARDELDVVLKKPEA